MIDYETNVAEIKLSYKTKIKLSDKPKITESHQAYKIFLDNWDKNLLEYREEFKVMFLNRANKVLGIYKISEGGISGTIVDVRLIMQAALKTNSSNIILCHNHPSTNNFPSEADKNITNKIKKAGELLNIFVLDHLIITTDEYYSFADKGIM